MGRSRAYVVWHRHPRTSLFHQLRFCIMCIMKCSSIERIAVIEIVQARLYGTAFCAAAGFCLGSRGVAASSPGYLVLGGNSRSAAPLSVFAAEIATSGHPDFLHD